MGFSPVAGIQWVETLKGNTLAGEHNDGFSPVAGIQWVETVSRNQDNYVPSGVSVPLPGFSGLRPAIKSGFEFAVTRFQSRCRDSVG